MGHMGCFNQKAIIQGEAVGIPLGSEESSPSIDMPDTIDALPSQVSEARAPQSRISRWQFPLDYAFNSGIWRTIGTTANSPDPDELAVVRFLAVRDVWQTSAWGNHQRTVDDYIL